jgi:hypothetical protein
MVDAREVAVLSGVRTPVGNYGGSNGHPEGMRW